MERKLWVPPPPQARPGSRYGPRERGRRSGGQRRRSAGGTATILAALIAVLGLLVLCICLLLVTIPALFPLREGGRINLLLLGIDRRNGTGWAYRTDTIIVVTLDPDTRAAGMLSIPRDLQVAIPGQGEDRINTANVYGYRQDNADGGPALLKATIEANFGIPIDGYFMVDFQTFEKIVDALGGIDVNVPRPLHDTRYPDPKPEDPYAFKTIHFDPGWQHMTGKRALVYVRSRMSTTDFDRAERQQLILLAIRKKALSLSAIPRWPLLAKTVMEGVKTDMDLGELFALALLAVQIDTSNLNQVVLEHPLVVSHQRADGAAVQLPNWDLINPVIEGLFGPRSSR
jgi:polyisoprenyl-teichoic acid--peptidoglycan teichoic acid transferase